MKENLTIPNLLSVIRIVIIPFFAYYYIEGAFVTAIILLALSGLSDMLDGFIARTFNMVSSLGKMLDPFADKLTQAVVVVCLLTHHMILLPLVIAFFLKELIMLGGSVVLFKNKKRPSEAKWWGKVSTFMIYATMLLTLLSDIVEQSSVLDISVTVFSILTLASIIFSFVNYSILFLKIKNDK